MNILSVQHSTKKKGDDFQVNDVSFYQAPLQKIAIAGATGSGKTTLLKLIAGLLQPTSGIILFEGKKVLGPDERLLPGEPGIVYLSQYFELRNHYRVEELLAMNNTLPDEEATTIYEVCRIDAFLKRWTHELSGGERQRIALAMLLIKRPRLLILDEPFSNLDFVHKDILKAVVADVASTFSITQLMVSHDPIDVLSWADKILVMEKGKVIQEGTPEEIYRQPVNAYAAGLFGQYNQLPDWLFSRFCASVPSVIEPPKFIRPEQLAITYKGEVKANITSVKFMGSYYQITAVMDGFSLTLFTGKKGLSNGDEIHLSYQA